MSLIRSPRRDTRPPLDRSTLAQLRAIALERYRDGQPVAVIARSLGLNPSSVFRYLRQESAQAACAPEGGQSPRAADLLSAAQRQQVFAWLDGTLPRQFGFDADLWSRSTVSALLDLKFGLRLGAPAAEQVLLAQPSPLCTCAASDLKAELARFATYDADQYALHYKQARKRHADILFWHEALPDDAGSPPPELFAQPAARPAPAPRIAWAVNGRGAFWFSASQENTQGDATLDHLHAMIRHRQNPCYVVIPSTLLWPDQKFDDLAAKLGGRLVLCPALPRLPPSAARQRSHRPA